MDTSFTRSLYIGRDKTAEVLKRKEAVEKELQAKREAKIREQNERMARVAQQKEAELRDRARQRQQRELEKQKAVLDRRCAQLEKQNAKKAEMLQRAHQQASRIAALNQQKKPAYVFGSSTPRELSYLEALKHQQRAQGPSSTTGKSSRDSTPSSHAAQTVPTTARMPSRFLVSGMKNGPSSSTMTRSVYGALGQLPESPHPQQERPKPMLKKPAQPIKQTPSSVKQQRKAIEAVNDGRAMVNNPTMTQSLYVQSSSRKVETPSAGPSMTKRQPLKRQQTPQSKVVGVSRSNLPLNKQKSTNLIQQNSNKMVDHQQQQQKPVIRPRKAQQQQQLVQSIKNTTEEIVPVQIAQKEEEIVMAMKAEDQMEEKEQVIEEPGLEEGNIVQLDESILNENESDIKKPEYEKANHEQQENNQIFLFDNENLGNENEVKWEYNQEKEKEKEVTTGTTTEMKIYDIQVQKSSEALINVAKSEEHNEDEQKEVDQQQKDDLLIIANTILPKAATPPPSATIILPDQEEREARRKRLNEILQRTRQETTNSNVNGTNTTSQLVSSTTATMGISATNPMAPQKDASALAQDILAKHRHKFKQQKQPQQRQSGEDSSSGSNSDSRGPSPSQLLQNSSSTSTTLANELAESGFFANLPQQFYTMPGQVFGTPEQSHHQLPPFLPPSSMTVITKESESQLLKQHPTPPEDPLINGHNGKLNGENEFHPPEPTNTDIIILDD